MTKVSELVDLFVSMPKRQRMKLLGVPVKSIGKVVRYAQLRSAMDRGRYSSSCPVPDKDIRFVADWLHRGFLAEDSDD